MKDTIVPDHSTPGVRVVPAGLSGALSRVVRRAVLANLEKLECGRITIVEADQKHDFGRDGLRATITCVDPRKLDRSFAGRSFDDAFLADRPRAVDACGENGEFHSFVYDGPIFHQSVAFAKGETVLRENRFHYCDLIPRKK